MVTYNYKYGEPLCRCPSPTGWLMKRVSILYTVTDNKYDLHPLSIIRSIIGKL